MKKIQGIFLDWAGTTVDYGCMAPVESFVKIFEEKGIQVTMDETREPMGMAKIDHIRTMLEMPSIRKQWQGELTEKDVCELNERFEACLFESLDEYTDPVPGAVEAVETLREMGLVIGTTTGYTREMIDIVRAGAAEKCYVPDVTVTADDVDAGRPYPWMMYYAAMKLGVYPMNRVVKVGDTTVDMEEGRNAGAWTVGLIYGSSELGLSIEEVSHLTEDERAIREADVREKLMAAGAHTVLLSISELPAFIRELDRILSEKEESSWSVLSF
ncbi:phosphonoacetaldehyde hydrolase [Domibacillus mangrovi]|uniref:Phosphonoacetaldehyde hydrolase n=1 Tax=Domibacillus mangrovi TaxID=1714354 RepID=A0A1Q5P0N8_9BACI|nr:phosphonoacetaldehyde hydrolase [Domibacillus mangrovi]OKL35662.1 phosphonoacetaldehyde hydrolase [Domibacillus mangrovi]